MIQTVHKTTVTGKFLTAEWRYIAMLNYEVDPTLLLRYIPCGTELDYWNGKTYVSVVGFMFQQTKVLGLPIPFHRNFEEVNLRFYVRYKAEEGWRRGVAFIKEIVPKTAIATVARVIYNENYVSLPMRHQIETDSESFLKQNGIVEYEWRFDERWNSLRVKTAGSIKPMIADTEEEFIAEHYWGYCAQRDGGCVEYRVEHPRWSIWQVAETSLKCDVANLYGKEFDSCLSSTPSSAFLADGSEVTVRRGVKLKL
jgi:uncharacterized protein